jgi:hypothetical protein
VNRRIVWLVGLALALTLAVLVVPEPEGDDAADLVATRPRAGMTQPPAAGATRPSRGDDTTLLASVDRSGPRGGEAASDASTTDAVSSTQAALATLRTAVRASVDLFPIPPVEKAAPPPPPPEAPPPAVPQPQFVMIGRMVDPVGTSAVMRDGEQVLTLRPGDRVSGFRMTAVGDDTATFVHEATGQAVSVAYGRQAPSTSTPTPTPDEAPSADPAEPPSAGPEEPPSAD